jgi:hypothetical protein
VIALSADQIDACAELTLLDHASIANRAQAGNDKIYNEVSLFKRQTPRADGQVWVEERTQVQADKFCPRPAPNQIARTGRG